MNHLSVISKLSGKYEFIENFILGFRNLAARCNSVLVTNGSIPIFRNLQILFVSDSQFIYIVMGVLSGILLVIIIIVFLVLRR